MRDKLKGIDDAFNTLKGEKSREELIKKLNHFYAKLQTVMDAHIPVQGETDDPNHIVQKTLFNFSNKRDENSPMAQYFKGLSWTFKQPATREQKTTYNFIDPNYIKPDESLKDFIITLNHNNNVKLINAWNALEIKDDVKKQVLGLIKTLTNSENSYEFEVRKHALYTEIQKVANTRASGDHEKKEQQKLINALVKFTKKNSPLTQYITNTLSAKKEISSTAQSTIINRGSSTANDIAYVRPSTHPTVDDCYVYEGGIRKKYEGYHPIPGKLLSSIKKGENFKELLTNNTLKRLLTDEDYRNTRDDYDGGVVHAAHLLNVELYTLMLYFSEDKYLDTYNDITKANGLLFNLQKKILDAEQGRSWVDTDESAVLNILKNHSHLAQDPTWEGINTFINKLQAKTSLLMQAPEDIQDKANELLYTHALPIYKSNLEKELRTLLEKKQFSEDINITGEVGYERKGKASLPSNALFKATLSAKTYNSPEKLLGYIKNFPDRKNSNTQNGKAPDFSINFTTLYGLPAVEMQVPIENDATSIFDDFD